MPPSRPIADRLADKLQRHPNGCLLWTGAVDKWGYGRLWRGPEGGAEGAHRVALRLSGVAVGPDDLVLHGPCDNPACCEPAHLRVGGHAENMRDRSARGRCAAKITAAQACELRERVARGDGTAAVARDLGLSRRHVQAVAQGAKRPGTL